MHSEFGVLQRKKWQKISSLIKKSTKHICCKHLSFECIVHCIILRKLPKTKVPKQLFQGQGNLRIKNVQIFWKTLGHKSRFFCTRGVFRIENSGSDSIFSRILDMNRDIVGQELGILLQMLLLSLGSYLAENSNSYVISWYLYNTTDFSTDKCLLR